MCACAIYFNNYPSCALAHRRGSRCRDNGIRRGGSFFKRNMHVCFSEQPPRPSLSRLAFPSYPQAAGGVLSRVLRKRQERCYPEYSASGSRGAIPSTPQAEGGVLSQVLRKRQSGCYPKYSASGRRGAIILKIKCHFITGTSAKSAHDNLVHPIHL